MYYISRCSSCLVFALALALWRYFDTSNFERNKLISRARRRRVAGQTLSVIDACINREWQKFKGARRQNPSPEINLLRELQSAMSSAWGNAQGATPPRRYVISCVIFYSTNARARYPAIYGSQRIPQSEIFTSLRRPLLRHSRRHR